jgi:CRP-like cAMP-binding protein
MEIFKNHLRRFIDISDEELKNVYSFFEEIEYKKKENLLVEGQISTYNYFVLKGCLRKFFTKQNGAEQTTQFALETWWITDLFNFEKQKPADCYIQAVEKSTVLRISSQKYQELLTTHPLMEVYFRKIYQKNAAAAERRIRYLYEFSREESYLHFSNLFPDFIQRIPQYLIASYLGFTPEYLSEIRAKLRS